MGSSISNTYIMGNDFYQNLDEISYNLEHNITNVGIGKNCVIDNTIIDKNCKIGNNVVLKGGKHLEDANTKLYTIKDGIIIVKKRAILEDGFTIE